jgi:hypothetical protein
MTVAVIADESFRDRKKGKTVFPFRDLSLDVSIRKVCEGQRN